MRGAGKRLNRSLVRWRFASCVEVSDQFKPLKLQHGFVEAVLYSAFVH